MDQMRLMLLGEVLQERSVDHSLFSRYHWGGQLERLVTEKHFTQGNRSCRDKLRQVKRNGIRAPDARAFVKC
jgi:hypothetical protein